MEQQQKLGRLILIIEDDNFINTFLDAKLKDNYMTRVATTTDQARDILAKESVDLILLDIMLPGQDGFVFLEELKKSDAHKAIPVIILSNLDRSEDMKRGRSLGAVEYLVKANYTPVEIAGVIDQVLSGQKS